MNVYTGPVPNTSYKDVAAQIWDVDVVDTSTVWAAGGGGNVVVRTTNGGGAWELKHFDMQAQLESLTGISAVDADTVWTVGNMGTVLKTEDGGQNWESLEPLDGYVPYTDVSAVDADTAWIVVGPVVLRTTDGGDTWETSGPGSPYSFNAIHAVDAYTAWAVGSTRNAPVTADSIIFKTIDGGGTWVSQESGVESPLYDVFAVDATTAWAVGRDGTILKTSDGGDARPDIISIIPPLGVDGTEVTIYGCDFGTSQGTSSVSFAGTQASEYVAWSDTQIKAKVPTGMNGEIPVTVTTPEGTSNTMSFWKAEKLSVSSVVPIQGSQFTFIMNIDDVAGTGFQPGAAVRLEKGAAVIQAYNVSVVSGEKITCTVGLFGAEPGRLRRGGHQPGRAGGPPRGRVHRDLSLRRGQRRCPAHAGADPGAALPGGLGAPEEQEEEKTLNVPAFSEHSTGARHTAPPFSIRKIEWREELNGHRIMGSGLFCSIILEGIIELVSYIQW